MWNIFTTCRLTLVEISMSLHGGVWAFKLKNFLVYPKNHISDNVC